MKYLTIEDVGEVLEFFTNQDKDYKKVEEEEEYVEDDDEEEYNGSSLIQK